MVMGLLSQIPPVGNSGALERLKFVNLGRAGNIIIGNGEGIMVFGDNKRKTEFLS